MEQKYVRILDKNWDILQGDNDSKQKKKKKKVKNHTVTLFQRTLKYIIESSKSQ